MQFYSSDEESGLVIGVLFEEGLDELPLGVHIMENLLTALEQKGGQGVPDTRRWLAKIKCQLPTGLFH